MSKIQNIAIVTASLGRPDNLAVLLDRLALQTLLPRQVIFSMESEADAPPEVKMPFLVQRIFGPRGACVQRNRALDIVAPEIELVVFYDDDFVPSRYSLERMAQFFDENPDVGGAEGLVLADGNLGPGITPQEAVRLVDAADAAEDGVGAARPFEILARLPGLYGCNMVYRAELIRDVRFDEALPLYAWMEDQDFGGRIAAPQVQTSAFQGVHCAEKRGRERNGRKYGYSQMCNPIYMLRKGTISRKKAHVQMLRNFLANHAKVFRPEPWVDRRGRVAGNWLALWDILRGRVTPGRIREL
ncbi:glycosyl transferase family 2 [Rhodobacter aestuarii]|uniref:Glycosyltransferase like family 2 n=1 Tax=Rhodobacter aestuarii TaxID=453582 RepID=A0A1N7M9N3_9RHOB|nr:glycosyltransferase [Rhodobacter aestuarii]PTV94942.1 glycosyl transferase family 2 [Rhodobacter aestuarii]SIS82825.1 Glycosyltransferase like family 2 [Rhodobacter aestuarii]